MEPRRLFWPQIGTDLEDYIPVINGQQPDPQPPPTDPQLLCSMFYALCSMFYGDSLHCLPSQPNIGGGGAPI